MSKERPFQIAYSPASFEDAVGHREYAEVAREATRPPLRELATRGWLTQDGEVRGTYFSTVGLRRYGHLELAMLNVPGSLTTAAMHILNDIGDYVVEGGRLSDGETMVLGEDLFGFLERPIDNEPGAPTLLRVVFLT